MCVPTGERKNTLVDNFIDSNESLWQFSMEMGQKYPDSDVWIEIENAQLIRKYREGECVGIYKVHYMVIEEGGVILNSPSTPCCQTR